MAGSSMGKSLVLTTFGESHGRCIGMVLDGCPAGLELSEADMQPMLDRRRPGQSAIASQRKEADRAEIISGVFRKKTTGAPIAAVIWNKDHDSRAYENLQSVLRPGHADYPAMIKYDGYNDYRGGGRFSGRLTATHVMGGAIAKKLLKKALNIETISYVSQIGKIRAPEKTRVSDKSVYSGDTRCPDARSARLMRQAILDAKKSGDSLGGIIRSTTTGLPPGLGEPVFGSLESDLSSAMYSIPSVKGVEFGSGFAGSSYLGSQNNDTYQISGKKITTRTNNSGGILGGISIGMPLVMNIAFKPASSIAKRQESVNVRTKRPAMLQVKGRHDPCVVPRAPPVVDSLVSLVLADHAIQSGMIGQVA